MEKIEFSRDWLREAFPEGLIFPSSTLISGPGGSGKPLVGYIFAAEWLEKGRNLVFLLTSTNKEYFENTMGLLGAPIDKYRNKIFYIDLDPHIDGIEKLDDMNIRANFVKPEIWEKALNMGFEVFDNKDIMVVGSALNLLFFSETYRQGIFEKIRNDLQNSGDKTYMLTVNSDAFKNLIEKIEQVADNLMMSRMEKPMKIYLKIERAKDVSFKQEEFPVPLSRQVLESIKREAEKGKKDLIPAIKSL